MSDRFKPGDAHIQAGHIIQLYDDELNLLELDELDKQELVEYRGQVYELLQEQGLRQTLLDALVVLNTELDTRDNP